MHRGRTDHEEDARGNVPNDIVAGSRHKVSAKVKGGAKEADKRQKTNGSLDAGVALDELEEKRNVVNGDKDRRARAGHGNVE